MGIWRALGVAAAVAVGVPAAQAAAPITLDCPAGTRQEASFDAVACVRTNPVDREARRHGPLVLLYPDGSVEAVGQVSNGNRTGLWTLYDRAGVKTAEIQFDNGNFHGRHVEFHPSGKVRKVESFRHGLRDGKVQELAEDGRVVREATWRANHQVPTRVAPAEL